MARKKKTKEVKIIKHDEASRRNIPSAEYQSVMRKEELSPIRIAYERRNPDLDPQLIWRGKDIQDWSDLVVNAPPLYIQEKVNPKVLIDDLMKHAHEQEKADGDQIDLFDNFNGLPSDAAKTEFYQHEANWSNRMILGDSLQVMASLTEREGLRGKVQCIYIDPPYGIKFNSNFQWSTTSRDVKDGKIDHITREPEQVKAYRDTWRDGIHSYLSYLRDRLIVARDLLKDSGSIFVQIGDENIHRVRSLMDEVFGSENFCRQISYVSTSGFKTSVLSRQDNYLIWYGKNVNEVKYRQPFTSKSYSSGEFRVYNKIQYNDLTRRTLKREEFDNPSLIPSDTKIYRIDNLKSQGSKGFKFTYKGESFLPGSNNVWKTHLEGMKRLKYANRIVKTGSTLGYVRMFNDFPIQEISNIWTDTITGSFTERKIYVVQTAEKVISRCIQMTTDPGDLVLDPTCGSGTTAYVAEQWGRRWITIDTSRVALALARSRVMGAKYPYYLLADSREGQIKEAEIKNIMPSEKPTYENIRQGFVYKRVPHITLKSIANNTEIDVIWEKYQKILEPLQKKLNDILGTNWKEWEIPRKLEKKYPEKAKKLHAQWWDQRISCQKEIDASIAAKADYEYLYDKPYVDKNKIRVSGPFTVESLSPHSVLVVDEKNEIQEEVAESHAEYGVKNDFVQIILDNLKSSGVQQAHKEDKINFNTIKPWPGHLISAEGYYTEGDKEADKEKRAAIFIGPEFGTVSRPDLVAAAREAGDADFDVLIACAFNYDAHSSEFEKLGRIPILKARMNADLHMSEELKNTGKGNLFVIFGEPDIDILEKENDKIQIKINGVDVFHPNIGEVRSDGAEGIACWFIDTNYNEESFFVRQAYFLGAKDPYKSLKTSLKAEINKEAWRTLRSDISRPFKKPETGRIAVKVINHLGDEVMKVYRIE